MNTLDLKTRLQQPYNREHWLEMAKDIFHNMSILEKPLPVISSKDFVKSFQQLGFVNLEDGRNLAMIEIKVDDTKNLFRNKVELRNLTTKLIDEYSANGVLVIYDNESGNYRFTFAARETVINETTGQMEKKETSPKRFTYFLGPGESCFTAAIQLTQVAAKGKNADMNDVIKAFNVEKVNKDFFAGYKKQYEGFTEHLSKKSIKASVFNGDDKAIRDFAKKMMGRIVFIYFLQKKGWMGVPEAEDGWKDGDRDFLNNLFIESGKGEDFYAAWLSNIFFNTLNKDRPGQLFKLPNGTKVKVPYLNGGLFEKEDEKTVMLVFPPSLFENLFEFFDQFNFTVYEDDPEERFLAVDPEMLGHIFENLLEDNKDKGAFYTPKEIVHYMCRESLIEYLFTKLNPASPETFKELGATQTDMFGNKGRKQLALGQIVTQAKEIVTRQSIEKLVLHHEAAEIINYEEPILKALKDVKICDPAIGSGAFPMGLLTEIYQLVDTMYNVSPDVTASIWKIGKEWNPARVKEQIIQNSIYGVDIEKGAVDIARLRFWLSLVVDEAVPKPLPNLDYKIVVGDSLLSKFGDEVIEINWKIHLGMAVEKTKQLIKDQELKLYDLQHKQFLYFKQPSVDKKKLQKEIKNIKIDVLVNQITLTKMSFQDANKKLGGFAPTAKETQKNLENTLKLQSYDNTIVKLQTVKKDKEEILHFFDWKLDFPEVMNEKIAKGNPGFDIVIGNPPYGNLFDDKTKSILRSGHKSLQFKIDAYSVFLVVGNQLLKNKGNLLYIIPSTFMDNKFEENVRDLFLTQNQLKLIHELDDKIFHSAVVHSMILGSSKSKVSNDYDISVSASLDLFEAKEQIPQSFFLKQQFKSIAIRAYKNRGFLDKISKGSRPLVEIIDIRQAIKSGDDKKYIRNEKKNDRWKPILGGKHISKYAIKDPVLFIHYGKHLACPRDPRIFEQPKILIREAGNEIIATYDNSNFYIMSSLYNAIIIDINYDLKFILALLNSSIFLYLMKTLTFDKTSGAFTKAKIFHYYELPVKIVSDLDQKSFVSMVDKILKGKSQGKDTVILEKEIDFMIYKLYELDYSECSIIEGNEDWMSKEEFQKFVH